MNLNHYLGTLLVTTKDDLRWIQGLQRIINLWYPWYYYGITECFEIIDVFTKRYLFFFITYSYI